MKKEKDKEHWKRMYDSLTNPEEIEKAKQNEERKKRSEERKADTGA